jgi:hypothetical protein
MNINIPRLISKLNKNKNKKNNEIQSKIKFTAKPRIDAPIANAATLLAFAKQYPDALENKKKTGIIDSYMYLLTYKPERPPTAACFCGLN